MGKSSVSYALARQLDIGISEIDDLHIALETLTTREQLPVLHYFRTNPDARHLSPEAILERFLSICRLLSPAIVAVINNHVETHRPIILEGDYALPEVLTKDGGTQGATGVWLYEPDEAQIRTNLVARDPDDPDHAKRSRVSWLHGHWLKAECERLGMAALPARPWDTLQDRIRDAVG